MTNALHHVELWTQDLQGSAASFGWILTELGWLADHDPQWSRGRIWRHPSGVYLVLEQSPEVSGGHDRLRAGLNHLALRADSPARLDRLRAHCGQHGWTELFADRYPHAGGEQHTALYVENAEGFELEIVSDRPGTGS